MGCRASLKTLLNAHSLEEMWTAARLDTTLCCERFVETNMASAGSLTFTGDIAWSRIPAGWEALRRALLGFLPEICRSSCSANREGGNPTSLANEVAGFYDPGLLPAYRLPPRTDSELALTNDLKAALADWATGTASPSLTPGLRSMVPARGSAEIRGRLKNLQRFAFLEEDDVADRMLERYGSTVTRIRYYRMESPVDSYYVTFFLTNDGHVAQIQTSSE